MPSFTRFINIIRGESTDSKEDQHEAATEVEQETRVVDDKPHASATERLSTKLKSVFGFRKNTLTVEEHADKIKSMTKLELDQYAEHYDIFLDRRQTKQNMINEFIQKLKEKN